MVVALFMDEGYPFHHVAVHWRTGLASANLVVLRYLGRWFRQEETVVMMAEMALIKLGYFNFSCCVYCLSCFLLSFCLCAYFVLWLIPLIWRFSDFLPRYIGSERFIVGGLSLLCLVCLTFWIWLVRPSICPECGLMSVGGMTWENPKEQQPWIPFTRNFTATFKIHSAPT